MKRIAIHLITASLLLFFAMPGSAWAEDGESLFTEGFEGEVSLGGGGVTVDEDSSKAGEYTGLSHDAGFVYGELDLQYNRGSYFMNLFGDDLGLDNRGIYWEMGKYGDYTVFAEYNQTLHLLNNATLNVNFIRAVFS